MFNYFNIKLSRALICNEAMNRPWLILDHDRRLHADSTHWISPGRFFMNFNPSWHKTAQHSIAPIISQSQGVYFDYKLMSQLVTV